MGRGRVVDGHELVDCGSTCSQEVSGAANHSENAGVGGLVHLAEDGDGASVCSRRDARGEHVQQDVALLRVEDPEALSHSDGLRISRGIRGYGVLERGAHTEVIRVWLAEVEGAGAVYGVEDGVVYGRVVDLVVDVESEGLRSLGWLPSSRHGGGAQRSGKQQQISEDGQCSVKGAM